MKKIIATALSLLMSFSLFACSKDAGTDNKDNSDTEMAWTVKSASFIYPTGATSVGHFLRTVHTCYPFLFSAPAFALV